MRTPLLMTTAVVLSLALPGAAAAQQGQSASQQSQQATSSAERGGTASADIQSAKDTIAEAKQTLQQARQDMTQSGGAGDHARTQVRQALQDLKDAAADLKADAQYGQVGTQLETSTTSAMSAMGDGREVSPEARRAIADVEAVIIAFEETGTRQQRSDAQGNARGPEGAQVTVDPANPEIAVQTEPPEVTVESRAPQVAVQTQQPEVTVQQPKPQVTVQQPKPEVTVQQPKPEVTVQQPKPEVTVQQARPEVTVQQARPEVTVQQSRPDVTVEQARPEVTVEQARPEVTVENQGEPQVTVENQGQPEVDVENRQAADAGSSGAVRPGSAMGGPGALTDRDSGDLAVIAPADGADRTDTAAAGETDYGIQGWPSGMRAEEMLGRDVYSRTGDDIGEVEDIILDRDTGRIQQVVVAVGGFLGIGEHDVALDYDRLSFDAAQGGLSVDTTREQLEAMETFRYDDTMTSLRDRNAQ